jgi:hypothetical protein
VLTSASSLTQSRELRWQQRARRTMANQYAGKAASEIPALKPYRGKPAVRNFRGGNGNVGIIRSPVRAIALPDNAVAFRIAIAVAKSPSDQRPVRRPPSSCAGGNCLSLARTERFWRRKIRMTQEHRGNPEGRHISGLATLHACGRVCALSGRPCLLPRAQCYFVSSSGFRQQ